MSKVDISFFENTVTKLVQTFDIYSNPSKYFTINKKQYQTLMQENIRTSDIQSFEFTYEEAKKKILERILEVVFDSSKQLQNATFNDLIRISAEKGLVSNPKDWFLARTMCNKTSHAYSSKIANEVIDYITQFIILVTDTLKNLKRLG